MIENYLIQVNASALINEYRMQGKLNDSQRAKVIQHVVDFMMTTFGENIDYSIKTAVAKATVSLFKCWEVANSTIGGIVS